MNWLLKRKKKKINDKSSHIEIYHNIQFPLDDILAVLYPLFGAYYPYDEFIYMIYTTNHIFCAYDKIKNLCIGCALLNNADANGGLYVMLFGVLQTNQSQGTGTQLLESVINWARQTEYKYIFLDVHVENFKAIGLYEKVGFLKSSFLPNYYIRTPKRPPHAIRMIVSLQQ
ncbi:unnamed protein product [Adineta steineri]|uniref:N-terminal methionine N(alpha)-acetyltransferase NatE n=1 Tax=Adineta steineri TaxID=433720 RepID=A0A813RYF9_9BILA|nr:unnamed protein product [Adineta steineri]CAF0813745.1 unnamed protein product [Adineta steineri]CAF3850052.1 unnamed protein product [Adineta steineri]